MKVVFFPIKSILRHVLLTLVLLIFCQAGLAELPKQVGISSFALALYDSHGLWGGPELFILADGTAYARVIRPPNKKESGMQEQRYKIHLSADEIQSIRALLDEHQFLTITIPERTGVPDEASTVISLRLSHEQRRDVFMWKRDRHAGFTAIREHLLEIVRRAEKTQPIYQGPSVYMWTPEGFIR